MPSIQNNLERRLASVTNPWQKRSFEMLLGPVVDSSVTLNLVSGGLAIKAGGGVLVKTVAATYTIVDGVLLSVAAADMPALTGFNVAAGKYGVCMFVVDQFGTVSNIYSDGNAASLGTIQFPSIPTGKACIGFIIVTYASAFTGGTTALDTATTVYVNVTESFNPGLINSL